MRSRAKRAVAIMIACATFVATACSSSQQSASASATPVSQHLPTLKHIKTLEFVDWTGKAYRFGTHWETLRPYVDYAIVSARAANDLAALGIKTGFYMTMHTVCIARSEGECQPDARTLPEAAFVHSCSPPYGRVMWNAEASSDNPHPLYQFLGDVGSPLLLKSMNDFIDRSRKTEQGKIHYDFAFEDNAYVPGDTLHWQPYHVQGSNQEQNPKPYCNYSDANYLQKEVELENSAHIPLLLNALVVSDHRPHPAIATEYLPHSKNAIGAMLEYAYGSTINGPEREKESDDRWLSEENSELTMVRGQKIFFAYPHNGGSDAHALDIRGYQYASLLIGFDERYVAIAQDGPGTNSGIGLNPEIGLVAADPYISAPVDAATLQQAGGAYVREFSKCTIWGKAIGGCAAIVNPDSSKSVDFPKLMHKYAHRIHITGSGVIPNIDTGKLRLTTNVHQTSLPAEGWALLAS